MALVFLQNVLKKGRYLRPPVFSVISVDQCLMNSRRKSRAAKGVYLVPHIEGGGGAV